MDDFTEDGQPKKHSFFNVIDFSTQGAALKKASVIQQTFVVYQRLSTSGYVA